MQGFSTHQTADPAAADSSSAAAAALEASRRLSWWCSYHSPAAQAGPAHAGSGGLSAPYLLTFVCLGTDPPLHMGAHLLADGAARHGGHSAQQGAHVLHVGYIGRGPHVLFLPPRPSCTEERSPWPGQCWTPPARAALGARSFEARDGGIWRRYQPPPRDHCGLRCAPSGQKASVGQTTCSLPSCRSARTACPTPIHAIGPTLRPLNTAGPCPVAPAQIPKHNSPPRGPQLAAKVLD